MFSKFIRKCNLLSFRPLNRLVFEGIFFFVAPACVVAFFYIKLGVDLMRRSRYQARNRILTFAFVLSWLMWIVCWSPSLAIMVVQYYYIQRSFNTDNSRTMEYYYSPIWTYVVSLRVPLQLLYSHLNPFIYLIVLKKFQKHHIDTLKWIFRMFLQTPVVQNSNLKNAFNFLKAICSSIAFVLAWAVLLIAFHHASEYSSLLNSGTTKASSILRQALDSSRKRISLDYPLSRDWDSNLNIRSECGELRGLYDLKFKRCYFIIDHQTQPLNSSELLSSCMSNGGYLCYPRNKEEISLLWKFFELWVGHNFNFATYDYYAFSYLYEYFGSDNYKYFLRFYKAHLGFERLGKECTMLDNRY